MAITYRPDDRQLRKMEQLRNHLGLEDKEYWRTDVIEAAIDHMDESITNLKDWEEMQLTPEQAKAVSTSVVRLNYYPQVK